MSTPTPSTTKPSTTTPRSIPSPALVRPNHGTTTKPAPPPPPPPPPQAAAAKSTPMTTSLSQASHASKTPAATTGLGIKAEPGSASAGVSPRFASPGAGIGTGSGAVTEGLTPGLAAALMGAVGGVGMGISLSEMGNGAGGGGQGRDHAGAKRDEEEERVRKVRGVLARLAGAGMGRVSDEGVRRVGRWAGLDVEVEARYEGKEWEGERPVVIAGRNALLVDLAFQGGLVSKVEVTFASEVEEVGGHQKAAAEVLRGDLTVKDVVNSSLDRFAGNLERLARWDRLSGPGANCVEAVTGLYTALRRVYEHEKKTAEMLFGNQPDALDRAEKEVMLRKSGRPGMHVNGRIGLSLDYWEDTPFQSSDDTDESSSRTHSLELMVEPSDPSAFPPIRISNNWISDRVVKPADETTDPEALLSDTSPLDWLEPDATLVQPGKDSSADDAMVLDSNDGPKQPSVRFVARLQPPLVLPFSIASQIVQSCGSTLVPTELQLLQPYETALLSLPPTLMRTHPNDPATTSTRTIHVPGPGHGPGPGRRRQHSTSLHVPKQEYAHVLTDLPFSHPRQIVALLPLLRQWCRLSSLLRTAFPPPQPTDSDGQACLQSGGPSGDVTQETEKGGGGGTGMTTTTTTTSGERKVDITLSTTPTTTATPTVTAHSDPELAVFFPLRGGGGGGSSGGGGGGVGGGGVGRAGSAAAVAAEAEAGMVGNITLRVGANGAVLVVDENVTACAAVDRNGGCGPANEMDLDSNGGGRQGLGGGTVEEARRRMARALEVTGDLGVWVEWVAEQRGG